MTFVLKNKIFTIISFLPACLLQLHAAAQNVGIGIDTPEAKLHIRSNSNGSVLLIDANQKQSGGNPLIRLRSSTGLDLLWVNSDDTSNSFVGQSSGEKNMPLNGGTGNSFFGSLSGANNNSGANNTAIGRDALHSNAGGNNATALGYQAMQYSNNTNSNFINYNTAVGYQALKGRATPATNTGNGNTVVGYQAMLVNSLGSNNTVTGRQALYENSTGSNNAVHGHQTLFHNQQGTSNVAVGFQSLYNNITGDLNTAIGTSALYNNRAGSNATAVGARAMLNMDNSTTDFISDNVAVGYEALRGSVIPSANTGLSNTAIGYQSLLLNADGRYNTACGKQVLDNNSSGSYNTGVGMFALSENTVSHSNTAVGFGAGSAYANGNGCTFIGYNAETNGTGYTNATALGFNALATGSNMVRIGNNAVVSIGGQVGWTTFSDGRFKQDVAEDIVGLEFILKLRPVSYFVNVSGLNKHLNKGKNDLPGFETNESNSLQRYSIPSPRHTGFIAQEVELAAHEAGFIFDGIDIPKNAGDLYGLRYAEFVVPLVKAVQQLNKKCEEQQHEIESLKKQLVDLIKK